MEPRTEDSASPLWDSLQSSLRFYLFIFREGEGREKEKERNIDGRKKHQWLPLTCPLLRTWPTTEAWDSNWLPLGLQDDAQLTEPHQPGLSSYLQQRL